MIGILESVNKYINENKISWQLASACESISESNSPYGYINKVSVSQVQKILEMNETDVVSYIKAGALKGVQYVPEFRNICKQVYKAQLNESHKVNYDALISDDFDTYFVDRAKELLNLIEAAMGKKVADRGAENTVDEFGASLE